ncbi:hypothetical protein COHA_008149 [Chlorella ohadii]|uniref:Uncharacterized protein n=1 Tax=Chlorella ohadii TaxID=2649997 RepID=A0AAD5DKW0_9CHLO|nr:hypothetical protein COHA_008149 [Chlorella ohadii]
MRVCKTPSCVTRYSVDAWHELKGIPFREDSYQEADWVRHLTWKRYIPEPRILSIVALSLAPVWLWSVFVSGALGLYATYAEPCGAPRLSNHTDLVVPFTITSFALSLLMLFRTNSCYGRWWEARTLWGSAYITCRSIMRLSLCYVGRDNPHLVPALHRWNAAFTPALASYLRQKQHYLDDHLAAVLPEAELEWLKARGSPPIAVLQVLSSLLDRAQGLSDIERQQLEALISHCDVITGGCERILRQPIPHAWNRHTLRFLTVYITFLPFAFWPIFGWATLPVMGVLTFLLAGVENVGTQTEEPSRILPLNQICAATIRAVGLLLSDYRSATGLAATAADVAAAAATCSGDGHDACKAASAAAPPAAVAVQLDGEANGFSPSAVPGKTPPPAVVTVRRGSTGRQLGSARASNGIDSSGSGGGWMRAGDADGAAAAGADSPRGPSVELSGPSGLATPSTARPLSPDPSDAFASA